MQVGKLRQRITFQENTPTQNGIGEWVDDWYDWETVWAVIEPATGNQYYAAKQLDSKIDGRVKIRYIEGIKPTMRIVYQGRILKIVSLLTVKELKKEIQIMYSENLD